jgi:flagellar biosynthesis/type III secretory pathway ATPase
MKQPVKVYLDAMTRYADAMKDLSTAFGNTRSLLVGADVAEDSFGLLPESRDAARVYEQRTTDGLAVLGTGEDVFGDMAVAFRQMRDNYQGTDQASARRLGGGS